MTLARKAHLFDDDGVRQAWDGISRFAGSIEPVEKIVHGHSPRTSELIYEVQTEHGATVVHDIDEGMTPALYFDIGGDDAYNPTRIPTGLRSN